MKQFLKVWLPWVITLLALWFTFRGIEFSTLIDHLKGADLRWLGLAVILSVVSYLLRSRRWQTLFERPVLKFRDAAEVLFLGFFMNNVLPARAGEFVRAHFGGRRSGEKRTIVLATIFSERLADGLTISAFFILFAASLGDEGLSKNFRYASWLFGAVGMGALLTLWSRGWVFQLGDSLAARWTARSVTYSWQKLRQFIDGLGPLFSLVRLPSLVLYSWVIWTVEFGIYLAITKAFDAPLDIGGVVLFMVAVNFSAMVPAAPGGIGVIEYVGSLALFSIGIDREHALSMVLTQHVMQYLIVGIPGAYVLSRTRERIPDPEEVASGDDGSGQNSIPPHAIAPIEKST